ncbi:DinB family protein [Actinocrispum sp. NPDC049592]|uniref:DinB family protein n=1 Tax=Actinocrispum sp. NPDC049592 TaxID=3154835 RepID=UPI00341D4E7D
MSNTSSKESVEVLERSWPELHATDELRLLEEFLTFLRITAVNKVAGLDRSKAVATPWPTSPMMSLLGVIQHLTAVERWWISKVGGGLDVPTLYWDDDEPDTDFKIPPEATPASVVAAYRAEWAASGDAICGMSPDDKTKLSFRGEDRTIRWILTHVIQETARHVGHLDVLREFADGQRGE